MPFSMGFGGAMRSEGTSIPVTLYNIDLVLLTLLLIELFSKYK